MTFKRSAVTDIIFLLLISFICHVLFSKHGFSPTDEGFVLSSSNRLLHGQLPHIDFSSLRPIGYAYLHIPELFLSDKYFFLISRFVFWTEELLIAYLWIRWIEKMTLTPTFNSTLNSELVKDGKLKALYFYTLVTVTFILNVHYFPCSVLHTIDGLLLFLVGLNIISSEKKYSNLGFLLIGYAALCKQNYLILLPLTLMLFQRNKFILNTIFGTLPLIIYFVFISYNGGWNDLIIQLTSHHELFQVGIKKYLLNYFFIPGIIVAILVNKIKINTTIYHPVLLCLLLILLITGHYHGSMSFLFIGLLVGDITYCRSEYRKILFVCLSLLWAVSISVGYNTPALFLGGYFSAIWILKSHEQAIYKSYWIAGLLFILAAFYYTRSWEIYRDAPAQKLTFKLDGIVEGANGIYTNKQTYAVLKELDSLKRSMNNVLVAPDFTACNIQHSSSSILLTEWPNRAEIPNAEILNKVTSKLKMQTDVSIAIPKYQTALLREGLFPLQNNGMDYLIIQYIKTHYKKNKETTYFEIYR